MARRKVHPRWRSPIVTESMRNAFQGKLTPKLIRGICEQVEQGVHAEVAAKVLGIPEEVWTRWEKDYRVKKSKSKYAPLYAAISKSEGIGERCLVDLCRHHSMYDPNSAFRFIGLRYPERWAEKQKVELSSPGSNSIEVTSAVDKFKGKLRAIEKKLKPRKVARKKKKPRR